MLDKAAEKCYYSAVLFHQPQEPIVAKKRPSRVLSLHITLPAARSGGLLDWFVQRLSFHAGVEVSIEIGSTNEGTKHVFVTTKSKEELDLLFLAARVNAADWRGTGVDVIH